MTDTSQPVRLLGISGSIRGQSYCTAVLRSLQESLTGRADLTLFPLNAHPAPTTRTSTAGTRRHQPGTCARRSWK